MSREPKTAVADADTSTEWKPKAQAKKRSTWLLRS